MATAGQIHDHVIPPLIAAKLQLEAVQARLPDEGLSQAIEWIELAIAESRGLLSGLVPSDSGEAYWSRQLQTIRTSLAERGEPIDLDIVGSPPWERLDRQVAVTVVQIVAEAIRNAIRHAAPTAVRVEFVPLPSEPPHPRRFRVTVTDDGTGFSPSCGTDHHGLALMARRAESIGAELRIDSAPGGPTVMTLTFDSTTTASGIDRLAELGD